MCAEDNACQVVLFTTCHAGLSIVTANMTLLVIGAHADGSGSSFTASYLNRLNEGPCLDFSAHNTTPPRWSRSFAFNGDQFINPSINNSSPTLVFMVCSWLTIFALLYSD